MPKRHVERQKIVCGSNNAGAQQLKVDSLGGPGLMRKDHIAEQTFYQGLTTHKNRFDFATITDVTKMFSDQLQKPPGAEFFEWIKTANLKLS